MQRTILGLAALAAASVVALVLWFDRSHPLGASPVEPQRTIAPGSSPAPTVVSDPTRAQAPPAIESSTRISAEAREVEDLVDLLIGPDPSALSIRLVDRRGDPIEDAWCNATASRSIPGTGMLEATASLAASDLIDSHSVVFFDDKQGTISAHYFDDGTGFGAQPGHAEYRFPVVPSYEVELTAGARGYLPYEATVTIAASPFEMEIVLERQPRLRGRCVDNLGEPASRVDVTVSFVDDGTTSVGPSRLRTKLGDSGQFDLPLEGAGPIRLDLRSRGRFARRVLMLDVGPGELLDLGDVVVAGNSALELQLVLPEGRRVSGWRATAKPVQDSDTWKAAQRAISSRGSVTLSGLIPGDHSVAVDSPYGTVWSTVGFPSEEPETIEVPVQFTDVVFAVSERSLSSEPLQIEVFAGAEGESDKVLDRLSSDDSLTVPSGLDLSFRAQDPDGDRWVGALESGPGEGTRRVLLTRAQAEPATPR